MSYEANQGYFNLLYRRKDLRNNQKPIEILAKITHGYNGQFFDEQKKDILEDTELAENFL